MRSGERIRYFRRRRSAAILNDGDDQPVGKTDDGLAGAADFSCVDADVVGTGGFRHRYGSVLDHNGVGTAVPAADRQGSVLI